MKCPRCESTLEIFESNGKVDYYVCPNCETDVMIKAETMYSLKDKTKLKIGGKNKWKKNKKH